MEHDHNTNHPVKSKETQLEKIRKLEKENAELMEMLDDVKSSITFQLGYHIHETRTLLGLIRFPIAFYQIFKKYKKKQLVESGLRKKQKAILAEFTNSENVEINRIENIKEKFNRVLGKKGKLKVAAVMDEFTFHCFAPECELYQLSTCDISAQLNEFAPDFIFLESAWQGKDGEWFKKVRYFSDELIQIIHWARKNSIPVIFWNKEDPVHFGAFLFVAKLADYVFTTDVRCIERYRQEVQHNRVALLPFAAQPKLHNPIEEFVRLNKSCFAGSYYKNYPQRQADFDTLMEAVLDFTEVDIYDRNYNSPDSQNIFPKKYHDNIIGGLAFDEISKAYKGYQFGINMNTIKNSPSMFARRVYELMASNTVVVSNYSQGIERVFNKLVINSDDKIEIRQKLSAIVHNDITYRKYRLLGLREVMSKHTYQQRLSHINSVISGHSITNKLPSVAIICLVESLDEELLFIQKFDKLKYDNKQLLIVRKYLAREFKQSEHAITFNFHDGRERLLAQLEAFEFCSFLCKADIYGAEYLFDLVLASLYCDANVIGKSCRFVCKNNEILLTDANSQYKVVGELYARTSIVKTIVLSSMLLDIILTDIENFTFNNLNMLSIDEFNYCQNGLSYDEDAVLKIVGDIEIDNDC